ncbi:MAG: hypothetical protein IAF38_14810 [Bacteroidia bacterium]|nr:hypothetical protein [Bacteroidia bacterium]
MDESLNTENKEVKVKKTRSASSKKKSKELLTSERNQRKGKEVVYYKGAREPLIFYFYNYQRKMLSDFEFFCLINSDVI